MTRLLLTIAQRSRRPHETYRRLVQWVPVSRRRLDDWLARQHLFFVVSTGRTGTRWLATLLNEARDARVEHEPVPMETLAHRAAVEDPGTAAPYIRDFRRKELYLRVARAHPAHYGEVNGILRRHVDALRDAIPGVQLLHLVRDGRDVVRSLVSRHTYGGKHPVYAGFHPPPVDDYARRWDELSELERACWVWRSENRYMRERIAGRARLEDIATSYVALREQVLDPLGLALDESAWDAAARATPPNRTSRHDMPPWDDWTDRQKATFREICGEEMAHYGYDAG